MASIGQLTRDIYRYNNLEDRIRYIIIALDNAADYVNRLDNEIKRDYQVNNNNAAISDRTTEIKKELEKASHFLKKTILPSIDSSRSDARWLRNKLMEEED